MTEQQAGPMTLADGRQSRIEELESLRTQITTARGEEAQIQDALAALKIKRADLESNANRIAGEIGIIDSLVAQPQPEPETASE